MEQSLEEYICSKPTLQAAIIGAQLKSKHERRYHNSDEFNSETRKYVCTEMDFSADGDSVNDSRKESGIPSKNHFEEAYLALDLNEEDEFDKWYEQLNCNLKTKESTVTTKECADSSNDSVKKNRKGSNDSQTTLGNSLNKVDIINQPGFDLRQLVSERNQVGQDSIPKNNSKRTQLHRGANNNRNNAPYQNKRNTNKNFRNSNNGFSNKFSPSGYSGQVLQNQNTCGAIRNGNFGLGLNSSCCSFHSLQVPLNLCQSCLFKRNTLVSNGLHLNMNNSANQSNFLSSNCNAFAMPLNTSVAVTPAHYNGGCCSLNHGTNTVSGGANIWNQSLNNALGCAANLYSSTYQHENNLNKNIKLAAGGTQTKRNNNSGNCGENLKTTAGPSSTSQKPMDTTEANAGNRSRTIDDKKNPTERKNIASVLGITSKDLEIDSVPVMLTMMQEILRNGITINLFPKKRNQSDLNSEMGE